MVSRTRTNLKKGFVKIGRGFFMKPNSYLAIVNSGQITIGNRVSLARNSIVVCHNSITIRDGCAIAPNVAIYDHDHRFEMEGIRPGFNTSPVVIKKLLDWDRRYYPSRFSHWSRKRNWCGLHC